MSAKSFADKLKRDQEPCKCGNCSDCTMDALQSEVERLKKELAEARKDAVTRELAHTDRLREIAHGLQTDLDQARKERDYWERSAIKNDKDTQRVEQERDQARRELEDALDEKVSLEFALEQKSKEIGRSEHRGNTVDYIYDKLETYSRQLGEVAVERNKLREALTVAREAMKMELRNDCACGFDEPLGEGYQVGTCYLHAALARIEQLLGVAGLPKDLQRFVEELPKRPLGDVKGDGND